MYIAGIGGSHVTKTPERLFRDDIRVSLVAKRMESMERKTLESLCLGYGIYHSRPILMRARIHGRDGFAKQLAQLVGEQ